MAPTNLESIVQTVSRYGPESIERLRPEVWDEIEAKYWASSSAVRSQEDRELEDGYRKRHAEVTARIYEIAAEHARLKAQMMAAEDEWRALDDELKVMDQKFKAERASRASHRAHEDDQKRQWFEGHKRSSEAYPPVRRIHRMDDEETVVDDDVNGVDSMEAYRAKQQAHRPGPLARPLKESPKMDSRGISMGIPPIHAATNGILQNGHSLLNGHAARAAEVTAAHRGASPRSRDSTERAAPSPVSIQEIIRHDPPPQIAESVERSQDQAALAAAAAAGGGFTAVNISAAPSRRQTPEETPRSIGRGPRGRKSLPDSRGSAHDASMLSTPGGSPTQDANATEEEIDPPAEISKSMLDLLDDGTVFTAPATMVGVPLAKISPDHPYWDPEWRPIEDSIRPALEKWQSKHEEHLAKGSTNSSKFLANRQINRGNAILKFLQEGDLHPYQIFGKQFINSNVRNFVNYDTLFRMVQVLEELPKFGIDCSPSEWLRQRLHEVYTESPETFNLAKTIHELYHDEKVMYLRSKSGFGNIGRPSGYKMGDKPSEGRRVVSQGRKRKAEGTPKGTPRGTPRGTPKPGPLQEGEHIMSPIPGHAPILPRPDSSSSHRKIQPHPGPHLQPAPAPQDSYTSSPAFRQLQAQAQQAQQAREYEETKTSIGSNASIPSQSPREPKKQRLSPTPLTPGEPSPTMRIEDDLDYDGYTSTDSYSNDTVLPVDWRVHQVKVANMATNTQVTQYWHWLDQNGSRQGTESNMFEHQVLKDVPPKKVSWGVYKEPFDFHLRLSELVQVEYSPESLRVVMATKPVEGVPHRGNVLAQFKRERTKRRFLRFMKGKGVKLIRVPQHMVDSAWASMDPPTLPIYDGEEGGQGGRALNGPPA
ncbi:hypothetical protein GQ53DRAFT_362807 [Thozetella sp. PMI_491]|nr:hypothetical protein GQ53DRAFT_362807 [Thozetella sp. PMI_491]